MRNPNGTFFGQSRLREGLSRFLGARFFRTSDVKPKPRINVAQV